MLRWRTLGAVTFIGAGICATLLAQAPGGQQSAGARKHLLIIADIHTGGQHDFVSHAVSVIERIGRESGVYNSVIRTDTQLVTKQPVQGVGRYAGTNTNAKNLKYFDAIFFASSGELEQMTEQQKADLLSFVRDDGKGFIGTHASDVAFRDSWNDFGDLLGHFMASEFAVAPQTVLVDDPKFPGMDGFPASFVLVDQFPIFKAPYSPDKIHVLMHLDTNKMDPAVKTRVSQGSADLDFPVTYTKTYGKGRVFYSGLGHPEANWDDPRIRKMYLEGIKWALGITNPDTKPNWPKATK